MVTNAGGGYSRRQQLAVTRWREDITTDDWGSFCYLRDLETRRRLVDDAPADRPRAGRVRGDLRARPRRVPPRRRRASRPAPRSSSRRKTTSSCGACRSPITAARTRSLELTSYAEVVLAPGDADLAHPAFSNLFVETRGVAGARRADLHAAAARRAATASYLVHVLSGRGRVGAADAVRDRPRALHRPRPHARATRSRCARDDPLSNTTGPVLDPIVSLRQIVRLPPGGTARLAFTTGYADTEADAHAPDREVPRSPRGRARARAGQHAQPDRAAAPRPDRRGHDPRSSGSAGRLLYRRSAAARRRGGRGEPPRPARAVEVRHLRRPADRCWCASTDGAELPLVPRAAEGARVPARARASRSISSC